MQLKYVSEGNNSESTNKFVWHIEKNSTYEHREIYPITKCGKKEMEDVSKLYEVAKDFKNVNTMVKVMTMIVNKCNVTWASESRYELLTLES